MKSQCSHKITVVTMAALLLAALPANAADTDGDGIVDSLDNCPEFFNPDQIDSDRDGVGDSCDNCPNYWNPEQYDADEDGIGNACDECTDQDGDGYGDPGFPTNTCLEDNCPGFANPDQADSDGDGIGDPCEGLDCGDYDGDGLSDRIGDLIVLAEFLIGLGPSPVSMDIANSGGCHGVNVHDLTYTWSFFAGQMYHNCDGPDDCAMLPVSGISLDHTLGLYATDTIPTGQHVNFQIRITGDVSTVFSGLSNGLRIYSPSGASWSHTDIEELVDFEHLHESMPTFDIAREHRLLGMTGSGADTIGLTYIEWLDMGLFPGFDSVTHAIEIGPIPHEYSGGEICLDSCWFPPGGDWLWSVEYIYGDLPYLPSWGLLNNPGFGGNLIGKHVASLSFSSDAFRRRQMAAMTSLRSFHSARQPK